MLVPGLGLHRVVGELVRVQVELASDEIHDGRRHELARSQQPARVAKHAQREAQLVAGRRRAPMFCRSSSLSVRFCPRIRSLHRQRIYCADPEPRPRHRPVLRGVTRGVRISVKWNTHSGDVEHGFRRSGTLVGAQQR